MSKKVVRMLSGFVLTLPFFLGACSSTVSLKQPTPAPAPAVVKAPSASPAAAPKPVEFKDWEPAPQGGGYYLDDGPAALRPANLDDLPDAVPQVEAILISKTKPYDALGQTFVPQTSLEQPYKQKGRASWYGRKFHGAKTANGEIYDMHQMTAAHPTLPLPSYAKVTNLKNGKSVIVRVNDRGPFLRGRIIDLSYAAAHKLDYIRHGSADVLVEKMTPEIIAAYHADKSGAENPGVGKAGGSAQAIALSKPDVMAVSSSPSLAPQPLNRNPLYLQIGAFSNRSFAENLLGQVASNSEPLGRAGQILSESGLHRVLVGPFATLEQANEAAIQLTAFVPVQPVIKQDLILP